MNYPRTTEVLKTFGIIKGGRYLEPRHARAGRYIHTGAAHLAAGLELDEEWFKGSSGNEAQRDLVVHEDCRPKLRVYEKFLRDHKPRLIAAEPELVHPVYGYVCHPDQIVELQSPRLSFANTIGPYSARAEDDDPIMSFGPHYVADPCLVLLELKSGIEQPWHELQMASYFMAVEHHYDRRPKAMALYLEADNYRLEPLPDPYRATSKFIALMSAYRVLVEFKSSLIGG